MSLIHLLSEEIELIQNDKIRDFAVEALDLAPEYYENINSYVDGIKRAMEYAKVFLDTLDVDDYVHDVVVSAVLLQDLTKYDIDEDGEMFEYIHHPLTVRQLTLSLVGIVGNDTFDNILRLVESSHGYNSPIPQVMPEMNDPVYLWILPFSNGLVKEGM